MSATKETFVDEAASGRMIPLTLGGLAVVDIGGAIAFAGLAIAYSWIWKGRASQSRSPDGWPEGREEVIRPRVWRTTAGEPCRYSSAKAYALRTCVSAMSEYRQEYPDVIEELGRRVLAWAEAPGQAFDLAWKVYFRLGKLRAKVGEPLFFDPEAAVLAFLCALEAEEPSEHDRHSAH